MAGKRGNPNWGKKTETDIVDKSTDIVDKSTDIVANATDIVAKSTDTVTPPHWKADLNRMICIKNISRGRLVYKSKRQLGYTIIWEKRNSTNFMELGEFINLKNSDLRFLTEPWIRIVEDDEIEILKYANVYQYYKDMIEINDMEELLKFDFDKFKNKFDKLPEGYKKSVAEHANQMIKDGKLDSIRIKNYIQEQIGVDLDYIK